MRTLTPFLLTLPLVLAACSDDGKDPGDTDTQDTVDTDGDSQVDDTEVDTDALCWTAGELGTCWDCDLPTTPGADSLPFLNSCDNATSYVVFDNAARIPSSTWVPGTPLPALP